MDNINPHLSHYKWDYKNIHDTYIDKEEPLMLMLLKRVFKTSYRSTINLLTIL